MSSQVIVPIRAIKMEPGVAQRGALVFAAGMVLAGLSFVVEQTIIQAVKRR